MGPLYSHAWALQIERNTGHLIPPLLLTLTLLHRFLKCLLAVSNTVYEFHPNTERKGYRLTLMQRVDVRGEKLSPDPGLSSVRCQGGDKEEGGNESRMQSLMEGIIDHVDKSSKGQDGSVRP